MILLSTALGGVWSLEQPSGSIAEYYISFREMLRRIFENGGPTAVVAPMVGDVHVSQTRVVLYDNVPSTNCNSFSFEW